jgi:hypothetical protein
VTLWRRFVGVFDSHLPNVAYDEVNLVRSNKAVAGPFLCLLERY